MKILLLSLLLAFPGPAALNAATAPEAGACEKKIASALRSSGLALREFSVRIGRVEGREVLGLAAGKTRPPLVWQDYLLVLGALDEGLASAECAQPPFELLVVASEPEAGRGLSRGWFAADIQALHQLRDDQSAWESGLKVAAQGAGFRAR